MSLAYDAKDRIRQATDIVDLVSGYLELRRRGSLYVATCPWHDDSHPSLQVNPARQSWKCWVCNIGGDVFSFVMQRENVDFRGALELLADRAGIELQGFAPRTQAGAPNDKKTLYAANSWAAELYHRTLVDAPDASQARQYLQARGVSDDSISRFRIGYAPNSWTWLTDRSKSRFSESVLEACGLIGKSDRNNRWFDKLRGRIIFPIHDLQNRPIAFGGRVLPDLEEEAARQGNRLAKYWNSPETRLFSKSDNLYGLNLVRDDVARDRETVVVEGYTDVIMAWQSGLRNVVAALGTAINQRHIRLLKRFADRITLLLDGDEAGQRRTNEILELFVAEDADLRVLSLPDGLDPFDFLQQRGGESLLELISEASDALEYKFKTVTQGVDLVNDTHGATRALDNMLRTLAMAQLSSSTGSARLREQQMITRLSRQFQIDDAQIRNRLKQLRQQSRSRGESVAPAIRNNDFSLQRCDAKEIELLEILVIEPSLFHSMVEQVAPGQFQEGPLREVFEIYIDISRQSEQLDFDSVMTHIEDPGLKNVLVEIDERAQKKQMDSQTSAEQRLIDVVDSFTRQENENRTRQVQARLDLADLSGDEEADLLLDHLQRKRKEHQLIDPENSAPKEG